jgi:putative DNA methylase
VPLASTFMLSTKAGKEAYVEPVIEGGGYRFTVKVGKPKDAEGGEERHQAVAGGELQVPDVGRADSGDYIKSRGQGRAHGRAADGHRCRRRARAGLSRADAGNGSDCPDGAAEWKPERRHCPQTHETSTPQLYGLTPTATSSPPANSSR